MDSCVRRGRMGPQEVEALFLCKDELRDAIDPVMLASRLLQINLLDFNIYETIVSMFEGGQERTSITEFLISYLPFCVTIKELTEALFGCGYAKLASRLFISFLRTKGLSPNQVEKSRSGHRTGVHAFFRQLKRMVHDAQFEDPRLALNNLAERFIVKMEAETNFNKQQLLADKCAAIMGAQIDAIAITFDNNLSSNAVFKRMKHVIPKTSNTLIFDVQYYGRLANASAISGDFETGENMLVAARTRAYMTGPCLELVNMLYIEVYVRLWQYEKCPTKSTKKSLLMWGKIGLESLEEEEQETKTLWRRMFILRMVFCLLGIGNRANCIPGCTITDENIREAANLLADIDKHWQGIETRRQMFYFVARARLSELMSDLQHCMVYINRAETLAREGSFTELHFIEEFRKKIAEQHKANSALRMCTMNTNPTNMPPHENPGKNIRTDLDSRFCSEHQSSRNFVVCHVDQSTSVGSFSYVDEGTHAAVHLKPIMLSLTENSQTGQKYTASSVTNEKCPGQPISRSKAVPKVDCQKKDTSITELKVLYLPTLQSASKTLGGLEQYSSDSDRLSCTHVQPSEPSRLNHYDIHKHLLNTSFDTVVLFETREDPSGCSHESPVNAQSDDADPVVNKNSAECGSDISSIKSDDLFGE